MNYYTAGNMAQEDVEPMIDNVFHFFGHTADTMLKNPTVEHSHQHPPTSSWQNNANGAALVFLLIGLAFALTFLWIWKMCLTFKYLIQYRS